jgi:DNA-binding CsgD family transcriptional regulator
MTIDKNKYLCCNSPTHTREVRAWYQRPRMPKFPSTKILSGLLCCLYDAASNLGGWDTFLNEFVKLSGATSAALVMHDFQDGGRSVLEQTGLDPDGVRAYAAGHGGTDVWLAKGSRILQSGWVGPSEAIVSQAELLGTRFFDQVLRKQSIHHAAFGVVDRNSDVFATFSVYRTPRAGQFAEPELNLLDFTLPHLRRAFFLQNNLSRLQAQKVGLAEALDAHPGGVVFFNEDGRIVHISRNARQILEQQRGLRANQNLLRAESPKESAIIEYLVKQCVATSRGRGAHPGGTLQVAHRTGSCLIVMITPVRELDLHQPDAIAAIAFISDPGARKRPRNETLSALFGLSAAENRVTILLLDGKSLAEISQLLGVTRNTLKTQLASIFSKTKTGRQSQLIRLLADLPPQS